MRIPARLRLKYTAKTTNQKRAIRRALIIFSGTLLVLASCFLALLFRPDASACLVLSLGVFCAAAGIRRLCYFESVYRGTFLPLCGAPLFADE